MKYHGRELDPLSFWSRYVDFPTSQRRDNHEFSELVMCPNPEHDNFRSPAFQINLHKPLVHCFSRCGIGGTWEHAVCIIEGLYDKYEVEKASNPREKAIRKSKALREARRIILRNSKLTTPRGQVKARPVKKSTARKKLELEYESYLPGIALDYLKARGIGDLEISFWGIGWDPDEKRIVIPAHDEENRLRFLIERAVDPRAQPKYLYTGGSEKSSVLFGAVAIQPAAVKYIVVTEGSIDTIRLHSHGIPAVGILGTGISIAQRRILARMAPKKVYLMFDKDTAGVRNIEIAYEMLKNYPLFVCRFPAGKSDPAELTAKEALRSIERAVPILIWRRKLREMRA